MGAVVGALAVLAGAAGALLHAANAAAGRTVEPSFWLMGVAAALGYGGLAVALRRSPAVLLRHVVAWIGLTQGLGVLATEVWLAGAPDSVARWLSWFGSWAWAPGYVAVVTVVPLLLPDGTLLSPRWRAALGLATVAVVAVSAGWALTPYDQQDFPDAFGDAVNPVGTEAGRVLLDPVGTVLLLAAVGTAVASLVLRHRRSSGVARQQLKWVLLGLLGTVALMVLSRLLPVPLTELGAAAAMLPLPMAIGVAVLRHGLWEVDVVLSRALLYLMLGGLAVAGYALLVGLLDPLVRGEQGAATLAAALVALLVVLAHDALRRRVNRWVHGWEDEPYAVLARLGDRLADLGEPSAGDRVLADVVRQVAQALHADHVSLDLGEGVVEAVGDPSDSEALEVPLRYGDERLGALTVQRAGGFGWPDRKVLDRLAAQTAVAARTVLLERAARDAHEHTVVAREEERRRLRHDLHDGIGPSLAALALQVETARDIAPDDPAAATALLDRLVPRLNAAVADVRALVHELRPPTLDELGLASAVRELAARLSTAGTLVETSGDDLGELPAAVEVAAYRIAGEAATNAVRHARATRVDVHLRRLPAGDGTEALHVEVCDDGTGLASDRTNGVGLTSMRLRAQELGGTLSVRTTGQASAHTSGSGTRVHAVLPLAGEPVEQVKETL